MWTFEGKEVLKTTTTNMGCGATTGCGS